MKNKSKLEVIHIEPPIGDRILKFLREEYWVYNKISYGYFIYTRCFRLVARIEIDRWAYPYDGKVNISYEGNNYHKAMYLANLIKDNFDNINVCLRVYHKA